MHREGIINHHTSENFQKGQNNLETQAKVPEHRRVCHPFGGNMTFGDPKRGIFGGEGYHNDRKKMLSNIVMEVKWARGAHAAKWATFMFLPTLRRVSGE